MGLNDELEKIRIAEEWLRTEPCDSRYYIAARDHLISLVEWSQSESLRCEAQAAIDRWVARNDANLRF
jgi:hypothetical protein